MSNPTSLRKAGVAVTKRTGSAQAVVTQTSAAVATTGATNSSPYGFTGAAQADAIRAAVNLHTVEITAILVLLHELRTANINAGLIKGS